MASSVLKGFSEARRILRNLPAQLEQAGQDALREWATGTQAGARRRVPVRTGELRDDIKTKVTAGSAQVGVFDPQSYYAVYIENGTSSQAAQPFLFPAYLEQVRRVPAFFKGALRGRGFRS